MNALRTLLSGIVDYAGLFPPASVDMPTAVRNYAEYRREGTSWMLGRLVVPIARLGELVDALSRVDHSDGPVWHLSGIVGSDVHADIARARAFNAANVGRARIDSLEGKFDSPAAIDAAATACRDTFELFVEVPVEPDPQELIAEIGRVAENAKMRTGGIVSSAIPASTSVVRFMRRCIEAGVPFKATAGLHHPVTAERALTYEADAPRGVMFGYLNVFLAAGFIASGIADDAAARLLDERDPSTIVIGSTSISWRGRSLDARDLEKLRSDCAVSFGSCSFREPVDEMTPLSPLPGYGR